MDIKKILFPTDFSEGSDNALPFAVDLAKRYSAKLCVIHIMYDITRSIGWYAPHIPLDDLYNDIASHAKKEIEEYGAGLFSGLSSIERILLKGVPYAEIIRFANENTIDLIVMGTHGRKGIDRVIFGSTAERVVRDAPCPVLCVRQPIHQSGKK